ncbi:hypothetical protein DH2020_014200 [Rehmannia glutinosa]|uniref:NAC domain-containing protein n=1 Tax=Rehmannia glutinosa TaxID=99300 RepID=A0ABR0WWG9_REHGL
MNNQYYSYSSFDPFFDHDDIHDTVLPAMININHPIDDDVPVLQNSSNIEKTMSDEEYLKMLPVGFAFQPKDEELIVHYLMKKLKNEPLPPNKIYSVNLYDFSPDRLVDILGENEDNELYIFTERKKISSNGTNIDRKTPNGYWKSTTGDKPIKHNGEEVGYCKALVYYYNNKSSNDKKTN